MKAPRIAATPLVVSDASAPTVVGLTPRQFRALVREHGIPSVRAGRRTLVRADILLAALDRLAGAASSAKTWNEDSVIAAAAGGAR